MSMIIKGQMINDRYQIIRTIGEGGMANVYLAHDTILDRNVAVKILRGDLADDEKFVRRFQREAIAASSLTHPNIVGMYDVGEDDGKYFIVMEYIDGKTLKSLIKKRGALTLPEVIDIMLQLTDGIACAHDSYIIHRDIKPQNVMILDDGMVKITDFGIAMALNNNELTQTNSVMGSVHYLPPEQANGSGSTIKSDIYSLGILMYELLTGKLPFKGDNAVEIAIKQMKEPIPSVCKINPEIPQSIENIILKACAKNPKNRYENVREMREDIKTALDPERTNEKRYAYPYPEQELEETKKMPNLSRVALKEQKEELTDNSEEKKEKHVNLALLITGIVSVVLVCIIGMIVIIFPKLTEVPEVVVPDVANKTIIEAEKILKEKGFEVLAETEEASDSEIEEGKVIKTNPIAGRSVKKGTQIKLIISTGAKGIVLEDYTGKNYYEIKAMLELNNIYVLTEKKEVDDKENAKENLIIDQKPAVGTKVVEGDTVTLYIPDIATEYPDFVKEKWLVSDVQKFCDEYNITLVVEYKETKQYEAGTILSQSRGAGTVINAPTTLRIVVAKAPEEEPPVEEPSGGTDNEETPSTDTQ